MNDNTNNTGTENGEYVELLPDDAADDSENSSDYSVGGDYSSHYKSIYDSPPEEERRKSADKAATAAEKYRNSVLIASKQDAVRKADNKSKTVFAAILCAACALIGCITGTVSAKIAVKKAAEDNSDSQPYHAADPAVNTALSATYTLPPTAAPTSGIAVSETESEKESKSSTSVAPTVIASTNAAVAKTAKDIYEECVNSVVGVTAEITLRNSLFGQSYTGESSGSGFIISEDGYILTNYHVVEGGSNYKVSFYDKTTLPATLIGYDKDNDIAVLKTEGKKLTPVEIGDSDDLSVGDTVLIIGNPLSLSYTLTSGVVSALNRTLSDESTAINMFQTDAAINSGNSGCPAFNMDGEAVGIATSKYADSTIEGLSFCIPIDDIKESVSDIISYGRLKNRAMLSVSGQTLSAATAARHSLVEGVYIVALGSGGAAEKAGIQTGDVITAIEGEKTPSVPTLKTLLKKYRAGDNIKLTVYRAGKYQDITLKADEYSPAEARTNYSNVFDF